jgi:hypothetical protein
LRKGKGKEKRAGKRGQTEPFSFGKRLTLGLLIERMKLYLKALAPYIAVVIFWCFWQNAWLAILGYHVQILFWNRTVSRKIRSPRDSKDLFLALPALLAGPAVYVLLPLITRTELSAWLDTYHLSGPALGIMIPYFGFVHPILEQIHWRPLRETSAWSHPLFAGYHMIVLSSLLTLPWLVLCFGALVGCSLSWTLLSHRRRGLTVPLLSHMFADLGMIVAAWARTQ